MMWHSIEFENTVETIDCIFSIKTEGTIIIKYGQCKNIKMMSIIIVLWVKTGKEHNLILVYNLS